MTTICWGSVECINDNLVGVFVFFMLFYAICSCSWHCLMSIISLECANHRHVIAATLSYYADSSSHRIRHNLFPPSPAESRAQFQLIERFFSRFFLTSLLNFCLLRLLNTFFFRTNFFLLLLFSSSCVFLLRYSTRCERDGEWVRECWCLSLSPKNKKKLWIYKIHILM